MLSEILEDIVVFKDCSNIDELPDITLTMSGQEYTLTGHDYVIKYNGKCKNGIMMADESN